MSDPNLNVRPPQMSQAFLDLMDAQLSETEALTAINERRARYWMTNLAVVKRVAAMREYIGKINREDIKFLRAAPHSSDAIDGLRKLVREASELAFKLADRKDCA
jgi:hypothetical protein